MLSRRNRSRRQSCNATLSNGKNERSNVAVGGFVNVRPPTNQQLEGLPLAVAAGHNECPNAVID